MKTAVALETKEPGPFLQRAKRVKSNSALYDLVEDLAASVDQVHVKLDQILAYVKPKEELADV